MRRERRGQKCKEQTSEQVRTVEELAGMNHALRAFYDALKKKPRQEKAAKKKKKGETRSDDELDELVGAGQIEENDDDELERALAAQLGGASSSGESANDGGRVREGRAPRPPGPRRRRSRPRRRATSASTWRGPSRSRR